MPNEFAQILVNSSGAVVTSAMFLWCLIKIFKYFTDALEKFSHAINQQSLKLEALTHVIEKQSEVTEEQNAVIKDQKDIIQKMYQEFLTRYKRKK